MAAHARRHGEAPQSVRRRRRNVDRDRAQPDRCHLGRSSPSAARRRRPARPTRPAPAGLHQAAAAGAIKPTIADAGGKPTIGPDPIALMKSVKNATEIAGARAAHLRDGAAVTRFLAWFDREAPKGKLTEIDAVAALE